MNKHLFGKFARWLEQNTCSCLAVHQREHLFRGRQEVPVSALLHHQSPTTQRPHLFLVPASPAMRASVSPAVYRRRRLAAVAIALLTVFTVWVAVQSIAGSSLATAGGTPMQTISASQPIAEPSEVYWTVRPGDTLWSIAQAVTPKGDIRPVLKRLDDRYGSEALTAGQNILVS